ncbi:unnamed protein product [Effrenium voratum]|nr:unnamed protein product [Effrenium voratum]
MAADFVDGDWKTFWDFLPDKEEPFLYSTDGRRPLSFKEMKAFILDERNDIPGMGREDRLCLVFPTGPELAVAYLAFAVRCTVAPLNLFLRADELDFEYDDLPCKGLVVQKVDGLQEDEKAATTVAVAQARKKKIQIILQLIPAPDVAGLFNIEKHPAGKPLTGAKLGPPLDTVKRDHVCLVLHTSGTTKKPKIVPITHESMAIGGMCHAAANLLGPEDVFVNTMPMFHIAGLMENLLMSAYSGCKFVALPGQYQAHSFFQAMQKEPLPTCYSAVPAHHMSLMSLAKEAKSFESPLRVIRNDSAALLPSLAEQMEEFFNATVLPAYSMTEANPLCSNPRHGVRKLKSVGPAVGPELAVLEAWPSNKRVGLSGRDLGRTQVKELISPCLKESWESRLEDRIGVGGRQWRGALHRFEHRSKVRLADFNGAIHACAKGSQWRHTLLQRVRCCSLVPDVISFSSSISAFAASSRWLQALQLLASTCRPNVFSFSSFISACEKTAVWRTALAVLRGMPDGAVVPNVVSRSSAVSAIASSTSSRWAAALGLTAEAKAPNVFTFSGAVSACEKGEWLVALLLLETMKAARVVPNMVSFNAAISASEKALQWPCALALLSSAFEPNVISYSSAISAVSWSPALALLDELAMSGSVPNVISLSAAIGDHWNSALELLRRCGQEASLTSFNAALSACSGLWKVVVQLWQLMSKQQVHPDAISFRVAAASCELSGSAALGPAGPAGPRPRGLGPRDRPGEEGEVCVKGACVMKGYEMRPHMDKDPNEEAFTDGFMRSGDKGWVDEDGYLYLIGRFKELINRAGEKISPFEVEDAVRRHSDVGDVLCFSCPHSMLGESVGVVIVPKESKSVKLFDLRQWLMKDKVLQDKWCPEVLVTMKELPKGATGKPARVNLAKKLGIETLDGNLKEFAHEGL